jgi:hypothetical protein
LIPVAVLEEGSWPTRALVLAVTRDRWFARSFDRSLVLGPTVSCTSLPSWSWCVTTVGPTQRGTDKPLCRRRRQGIHHEFSVSTGSLDEYRNLFERLL